MKRDGSGEPDSASRKRKEHYSLVQKSQTNGQESFYVVASNGKETMCLVEERVA